MRLKKSALTAQCDLDRNIYLIYHIHFKRVIDIRINEGMRYTALLKLKLN